MPTTSSQNAVFFDFHFHPVFKQMLCKWEDTCATSLTPEVLRSNIDLRSYILKKIDAEFLHILASQASVTQLKQGNLLTGVASVAPIELGFAASINWFGKILRSNITRPIDTVYFSNISGGKVSYYRLFLHELELYIKLTGDPGTKVAIL